MAGRGKAGGPSCLLLSGNVQEGKCCHKIQAIALIGTSKCHKRRTWRKVNKCLQLNRVAAHRSVHRIVFCVKTLLMKNRERQYLLLF